MFRSVFFRLDPTLDLLFFRIIFVFLVLEAIGAGFNQKKAFCQMPCLLYKGEQKLLDSSVERFSFGNREVLTGVLQENKFYIKGKALGISDVKYWKNHQVFSQECYVLSKKESLKIEYLKRNLKNFDLKSFYPKILVTGIVKNFKDYFFLKKEEQFLDIKVVLDKNFEKNLFKKIYEDIFHEGKSFFCQKENFKLTCEGTFFLSDRIRKTYFITWDYLKRPFSLKIHIIQNEKNLFDEDLSILEKEPFSLKKGHKNDQYFSFEGEFKEGILHYKTEYIKENSFIFSERSHKRIFFGEEILLVTGKKKGLFSKKVFLKINLNYGTF